MFLAERAKGGLAAGWAPRFYGWFGLGDRAKDAKSAKVPGTEDGVVGTSPLNPT